ncbi:hypothetical protein BDQ17DRAFT_1371232 [Cyathus striatus]|nr:hypothetical protein BDQ17DRAFT_1371232 [Cyathus striatus]
MFHDIEGIPKLLQAMPNLISFTLNGGYDEKYRTTILPQIQSLKLRGDCALPALRVFVCPCLTRLALESDTNYKKNMSSVVVPFLKRSKCQIEELEIAGIDLNMKWKCEELCRVKRLRISWPNAARQVSSEQVRLVVQVITLLFGQLDTLDLKIPYHGEDIVESLVLALRLLTQRSLISDREHASFVHCRLCERTRDQ